MAFETIVTNSGTQSHVIQGAPVVIDKRRAEAWLEKPQHTPLRLLIFHQASPIAGQVEAYAQYLSNLLEGQLSYYKSETRTNINLNDLAEQANHGYNLVVFGEPNRSWLKELLTDPAGCQAVNRLPMSVLVVRQPCWPLRRILLITQGHETDSVAVDWLLRMAQPSSASVTILALGPDMSPMYQQAMIDMPQGLSEWLIKSSPLGQQLRRIAERLGNWEIEKNLQFRQGSPEQQIQSEVDEENYDLITVAADPSDWWRRRLLGEVVNPLLRWIDRSVLVAKPTIL